MEQQMGYFVRGIIKGDPRNQKIEYVSVWGDRTQEDARRIAFGIKKKMENEQGYDHAFVHFDGYGPIYWDRELQQEIHPPVPPADWHREFEL